MKTIDQMSPDELLEYCLQIREQGASFKEYQRLFEKHEVDDEVRRFVMQKLDKVDRELKKQEAKQRAAATRQKGFINLVAGGVMLLVGALIWSLLYGNYRRIYILNIVVFGLGAIFLLRGFSQFVSGRE